MDLVTSYAADIHRTLPASHEAEQGVLCSCLLDPRLIDEVAGRITGEHFFNPGHRILWKNMQELWTKSHTVDMITLAGFLQDKHELSSVGGPAYLAELQTVIPTTANLNYYLEILSEKFRLREVIRVCTKGVTDCYERQDEVTEVLGETLKAIKEVNDKGNAFVADPTDQTAWLELMDDLEDRYDHRGENRLLGIPTGLPWFDALTQGLTPETFYLVCGRPSEGKSALVSQFQVHGALLPDPIDSLVFSHEMNGKLWRERQIAQTKAMTAGALRSGLFRESDFAKITNVIGKLREHCFVYAKPVMTVPEIAQAARRGLEKHPGIKWIGVDYLQLVRPDRTRKDSKKYEEIAETCQALNALKQELGLPIVACAALNREKEGRKDGKPKLSDLSFSGQIEYDIDCALLLNMEENGPEMVREGQFILGKNRSGGLDSQKIYFSKKNLLFSEHYPD